MPRFPPAEKLEAMIRTTIVAEMIAAARAANLPDAFIRGITLTRVSDREWKITNEWGADSEDSDQKQLAQWFEHGTRDHWISPVRASALVFPNPAESDQKHGQAIYFKSDTPPAGSMVFSKGHYVRGLPKTLAMHHGFEIGRTRLFNELQAGGAAA